MKSSAASGVDRTYHLAFQPQFGSPCASRSKFFTQGKSDYFVSRRVAKRPRSALPRHNFLPFHRVLGCASVPSEGSTDGSPSEDKNIARTELQPAANAITSRNGIELSSSTEPKPNQPQANESASANGNGSASGAVNGSPSTATESVGDEKQDREAKATTGFFAWAWTALKRALAPGGFFWGVAAGVAVSIAVFFFPSGVGTGDAVLREKVTLFNFILQDIDTSYVDKVDINKLFETGVNSMLGSLDPYTQFENNSQAVEMSVKTNGRYAGVGLGISLGDALVGKKERPVVVVSAFEGYAFDAGIRPGDVIETVAGTKVTGLSLEKVTDMLRGEPGTDVNVSIRREGVPYPLQFTLSRKSVHIKDVPVFTFVGNPKDGIGYIRLQSFAKDAASEVQQALRTLLRSADSNFPGSSLRGLVLDLRGNPGGLLNAAIDVSEIFVPKDSTIVSTKGRGLGLGPTYKSSKDPVLPLDLPVAVLVNGQTASASEIVAGAIQDLDYGIIVGSKTFGKGLVQNVQELPFNTALKYTVGKYYTPSGRCIQALNYQQSDGDGPVEATKVEENQRQEFKTRVGRTVRDGGGIEPDVEIQSRPSFLELALQRQNMYFRFANRYGAELKQQTLPDDFTVSDSMYRDFVKYVSSSAFKYESKFDDAFSQLDEMYKDVGYETARTKVSDLKRATQMDMKSDFIRHENAIRFQLESAIRYRFQPDSQRIIAELKNDDQLAEAIRLLKDPVEYSQLLSAKATAEATPSRSQPVASSRE